MSVNKMHDSYIFCIIIVAKITSYYNVLLLLYYILASFYILFGAAQTPVSKAS